ncbi:GNAT family N-acetyltransferase [Pseudomonas fragi]|uniref:GNAT family N-acetyltransferase n=1 Tax=Pseudomonas fragi TaxID=296 RepID=UPI0002FE7C7E|nr:GNAT family N-acetyltransferase [Pseudomonas fragi]MDE4515696.1 GNAT family N-acetyltransferase [Pseudomonas fragi]QPC34761.1 GNAT family N-acetyltransferase [Pseudomonas fragi]SDU63481.1 putative acetyltransferase [Pseudomonas fragi]
MQHTWAIHTPRLTDFAELTNVWEASVRATHDFLPDSYIELLRGLVLEQYLDTVMLICCKDPTSKRITGFAGVAAGKVEMLFIHPDYRGLGIGKCLLMFAINELNAERLDVNEQNLQAVGFYLKQGFVAAGRCEKDGMGQPYPLLHLRYKRPARA